MSSSTTSAAEYTDMWVFLIIQMHHLSLLQLLLALFVHTSSAAAACGSSMHGAPRIQHHSTAHSHAACMGYTCTAFAILRSPASPILMPELRSSREPQRNKKPKRDDVVNSCEANVNRAAAASCLRFGRAPGGTQLVIFRPYPDQRSPHYRPTTETLAEFISTSLEGNQLYQQDSANRSARAKAVFNNISHCPTKAFPRIVFNKDMVCFTNRVLLLANWQFYSYDNNNELDVGMAASPYFKDQAYHPDSEVARRLLKVYNTKAAVQAAADAEGSATVPSEPQLTQLLGAFFDDQN